MTTPTHARAVPGHATHAPCCALLAPIQPDRHRVTIKAVPRQGLATMYCMTNVMKFQQQFLNWQILNWTKMDDKHIKIHLQVEAAGREAGIVSACAKQSER